MDVEECKFSWLPQVEFEQLLHGDTLAGVHAKAVQHACVAKYFNAIYGQPEDSLVKVEFIAIGPPDWLDCGHGNLGVGTLSSLHIQVQIFCAACFVKELSESKRERGVAVVAHAVVKFVDPKCGEADGESGRQVLDPGLVPVVHMRRGFVCK